MQVCPPSAQLERLPATRNSMTTKPTRARRGSDLANFEVRSAANLARPFTLACPHLLGTGHLPLLSARPTHPHLAYNKRQVVIAERQACQVKRVLRQAFTAFLPPPVPAEITRQKSAHCAIVSRTFVAPSI